MIGHRVTWFHQPDRPVEGNTIHVRPAPAESDDPWDTPCVCGHPMREHILDWDLDPEVDCRTDWCDCPEYCPDGQPSRAG